MGALTGPDFPKIMGLAVSGGGDSMAMLHLAAGWARIMGIGLRVATVDHGLRAEARDEVALVAAEARLLGLGHDRLDWSWDGTGNLMQAAREARLRLIGDWIGPGGIAAFAHTEDDLAETFLMRLRRGSGVEGLSAMAARRSVTTGGVAWTQVRPLLQVSRADLRHYLKVLRIPHAEDPTNDDPAYDRSRIRRLLATLEAEGLGRETLAATARRLSRASEALAARAAAVAAETVLPVAPGTEGSVVFDRDRFDGIERDTLMRLFAAALQFVARAPYRPRASALEDALDRWLAGGTATLHGAMALNRGGRGYVIREPAAVGPALEIGEAGVLWDGRWRIGGAKIKGLRVAALGAEGLRQIPAESRAGLPAALLESLPAIWDGADLVGCGPLRHGVAHDWCFAAPPFGAESLLAAPASFGH